MLEEEDFYPFENPEKDEQDCNVLDPGKLNHLPEAWLICGKSQGIYGISRVSAQVQKNILQLRLPRTMKGDQGLPSGGIGDMPFPRHI